MPDDWEWFWAGEGGRDNLLRDEISGLQSQASAARSQAARLSSQLAKVQGSLETRLTALAAAFDAYVELGDVREQLAGYPDTSAVRRDATAALAVLTRGGIPDRLPANAVDYWLTDAVNAVIALAEGSPDRAAEARAGALDRDAELFVVTAAGAIGRGPEVADRVPPLLVTDGELTPAQRALWTAVLAGEYGEDALPAVHEPWRPTLAAPDADWPGWVERQARATSPAEQLRWLEGQLVVAGPGAGTDPAQVLATGEPVPAAELVLTGPEPEPAPVDPRTTARTALAAVALALVGRGMGEEVALLERARDLRARIETPNQAPAGRSNRPSAASPAAPTALAEVRAAFLAAPAGSAQRAELGRWIQPHLLAVVDAAVAEATAGTTEAVVARTPGGLVDVSLAGVTPDQRRTVESRVQARHAPPPRSTLVIPVVVAAVFLVVTVVSGALGPVELAVLTGLGTAISVGVIVRALTYERRRRRDLEIDLRVAQTALDEAVVRAQQAETARQKSVDEVQRLAIAVRDRLSARVG